MLCRAYLQQAHRRSIFHNAKAGRSHTLSWGDFVIFVIFVIFILGDFVRERHFARGALARKLFQEFGKRLHLVGGYWGIPALGLRKRNKKPIRAGASI
jgi:F420-0:gamma-glutamyl ligase-like protein